MERNGALKVRRKNVLRIFNGRGVNTSKARENRSFGAFSLPLSGIKVEDVAGDRTVWLLFPAFEPAIPTTFEHVSITVH